MSILLVEDNPISAKVLDYSLRKHHYATVLATNGKEALQCLDSMAEIDLVITDLSMPEMDGFTLLSTMKNHPVWSRIPVIVASVLGDVEAVQRVAGLGCKHFLVKPINSSLLLEVVRVATVKRPRVLRDRGVLQKHFGIDGSSFAQIAEEFAGVVRNAITQIEQYLTRQSSRPDGLELVDAHLLEGAMLLGADRLVRVLECLGRQEDNGGKHWSESESRWLLRELKLLEDALLPGACEKHVNGEGK